MGVPERESDGPGSRGQNPGGARPGAGAAPVAPGVLEPEDAKLVILARSARPRAYVPRGGTAAAEGAAVRDTDGRTYAAATVENADARLSVSALRAAVVAAASSGARRFEAAAIVSERVALPAPDGPAPDGEAPPSVPGVPAAVPAVDDLLVLGEFGAGVPVFLASPDGVARGRVTT
ncbi:MULTISPECIES: cytidine deaminase [unclassified Frankia]|uniref:cytidine deaminase n=1 Tax=unclassified Frankia TaxID=2632575 RepID=UPI00351D516B